MRSTPFSNWLQLALPRGQKVLQKHGVKSPPAATPYSYTTHLTPKETDPTLAHGNYGVL